MGKSNKEKKRNRDHWHGLLLNEFKSESDRACVILAASLLDNALLGLLQARLAPCPTSSDPLFDGANAPLSTFSSRIDCCYRLGLLSARLCRDLHLIRRIRNEFAHNVTGSALEESATRDRIQSLASSSRFPTDDKSWHDLFPDNPKGQFLFCVGWMQWHIRTQVEEVKAIAVANDEWGYTDDWVNLDAEDDA